MSDKLLAIEHHSLQLSRLRVNSNYCGSTENAVEAIADENRSAI